METKICEKKMEKFLERFGGENGTFSKEIEILMTDLQNDFIPDKENAIFQFQLNVHTKMIEILNDKINKLEEKINNLK